MGGSRKHECNLLEGLINYFLEGFVFAFEFVGGYDCLCGWVLDLVKSGNVVHVEFIEAFLGFF